MQENGIIRLAHRGTGGQQGWIYDIDGILLTIPSSCYKDPPKIVVAAPTKKSERNCVKDDNKCRKCTCSTR